MISIDGSKGEGGGQILRTSLALSMITGQALRIDRIRAGRPKPGLMRQHLTSVEAARSVCNGTAVGAQLGSTHLEFIPGPIRGGAYSFAIGTAGSTTLVLQTILPALITAGEPSTVTLTGGTHNIHAPTVHFLQRAYLPLLNRMGASVDLELERYGFYPAGGGRIRVDVQPAQQLRPFDLTDSPPVRSRRAIATIAGLPPSIAKREIEAVREALAWPDECLHMHQLGDESGPGNVVSIEIERENVTEVFTGFGRRGVSAEQVATTTTDQVRRFLDADVPVWEHLADQLMLPLAIAGGGRYLTGPLSLHATTNADVIESLLDAHVHMARDESGRCLVTILR